MKINSEELKENTKVVSILQSALIYYDENNQYGYALKQILPVGNYSWIYCNQDGTCLTQQFLEHVLAKQKLDLKNNPKACVIDFYANVDIELPTDCTAEQLQKAEELNLLERCFVQNETNLFTKEGSLRASNSTKN